MKEKAKEKEKIEGKKDLVKSAQKFAIRIPTMHWREPYNYICNFLKLPLLKNV